MFSQDGRYLYAGNFIDEDITIQRVDGDQLVNTGKSLKLPGHPASMRGRTQYAVPVEGVNGAGLR